jgi:hypothetical protein
MATAADTWRLTEAHRLAQVRLGAQTAAAVADLWRMMDPDDLDGSTPAYLRAALPLIERQYDASARLAAGYYGALRSLVVGPSAYRAEIADALERRAVMTSLVVTGPVRTKSAIARAVPLERAMELGQAGAASAAMRYSLDGGRETLLQNVRTDQRATGYKRVTSSNACDFCEGLAGIPITNAEAFPAHDHCSCSGEPTFK